MAEKSFGIKELNLIGASGTPSIDSPNNLNLNAVNVAISTNVSIGGTLSVTGNVSIGGTLTYEDVTNIDSVGIVTAREGVFIPDNKELKIGNTSSSPDLKIYHNTSNTLIENSTGQLSIENTASNISIKASDSNGDFILRVGGSTSSENAIVAVHNGEVILSFNGNTKLTTTNTGVTVTGTVVATGADINGDIDVDGHTNLDNVSIAGVVTATTFSGSGASLTSLPAANLTGTLPAISGANLTNLPADTPTNSDIQVVYTVTANGTSAYRFAGNGVVSTADDPDLYLIRGQKYRFINNSGGSHPFQIREASGGTAYSTGVTNNGASSGNIDFAPTFDSPAQLVYQCTSHGSMVGNIYLRDAAGNNTNVGVTTFANITANNINGTPDINVGTGEVDIYSTGSGDQLSLRLLNSDASAGNKIGIYFGPANNVAGAFIKGHAESDFTSAANRDAGLIFGTRLNANFLEAMKISAAGIVTKPSYHPAFRAGRSSDVNPGANGTVVFNYVSSPTHFNQGGHYSNSTGAFTAPIAGIYNFYTQVLWENVPDGQDMADAIMLYYNSSGGASGGTLVSYDARRAEYIQNETGNAGYYGAFTTLLFYMAANSSIYVRNARNLTIHGNANFTFFQGYLVG